METGSTPRPLVQKKTWRDSLSIDMLLSAVYVLVVAQSSSEIQEGITNNPVLRWKARYGKHRTGHEGSRSSRLQELLGGKFVSLTHPSGGLSQWKPQIPHRESNLLPPGCAIWCPLIMQYVYIYPSVPQASEWGAKMVSWTDWTVWLRYRDCAH